MEEAIKFIELKFPDNDIKISAQVYLQQFYTSLGFHASGEPYDEDCLPHIDMIKSVNHTAKYWAIVQRDYIESSLNAADR